MKKIVLSLVATTTTVSATASSINNPVTTTSTVAAVTNNMAEFSINEMAGIMEFPVKDSSMGFVKNGTTPIRMNYSIYASSWTDFVSRYPNFKFTSLNLETSFRGDVKSKSLTNKTFNTAELKKEGEITQVTLAEIESKYVTDFIKLSVIAQVQNGFINFGIFYNLNISQQYGAPYPFLESIADKIQFFTA